MPYFVYRVETRPIKRLEKIESFPAFRDASAHAKAARTNLPDGVEVKVIFADNELHAEDLLSTVRDPQLKTEDD